MMKPRLHEGRLIIFLESPPHETPRLHPFALSANALLSCAGAAFAANTLVYRSEGSPEGFNPQCYTTGTTNIVPGLAESWMAASDGLSYTLKLRKGVGFHASARLTPTRDFNADDVLTSYHCMADPAMPKTTPGTTYAYFDERTSRTSTWCSRTA